MTIVNVAVGGSTLVLDTMCLAHFARADRLDVFRDILIDSECWTTGVVMEELRLGATDHPVLRSAVDRFG
jgi:hypothetical protein